MPLSIDLLPDDWLHLAVSLKSNHQVIQMLDAAHFMAKYWTCVVNT